MINTNKTIVLYELRGGCWEHTLEMRRRVYSTDGISPTLLATNGNDFDKAVKIEVEYERNKSR